MPWKNKTERSSNNAREQTTIVGATNVLMLLVILVDVLLFICYGNRTGDVWKNEKSQFTEDLWMNEFP